MDGWNNSLSKNQVFTSWLHNNSKDPKTTLVLSHQLPTALQILHICITLPPRYCWPLHSLVSGIVVSLAIEASLASVGTPSWGIIIRASSFPRQSPSCQLLWPLSLSTLLQPPLWDKILCLLLEHHLLTSRVDDYQSCGIGWLDHPRSTNRLGTHGLLDLGGCGALDWCLPSTWQPPLLCIGGEEFLLAKAVESALPPDKTRHCLLT